MIPMEAAEKEAVEELKRRTLSDVTPKMLKDELLFYRFCKARDFNVSQAESMLRKHISWRKEFQIDTMLSQYKPPEVLVKYAPSSFLCFTKDGALIRYVDCGGTDLKGLLRSSSKIELMKYFIHFVEDDAKRAIAHHNKMPTEVPYHPFNYRMAADIFTGVVTWGGKRLCAAEWSQFTPGFPLLMYAPIFDFRDFTYTNATSMKGLQWLVFVVKSYMDNYPEKLKYAMFINAPSYCTFLYSVIRQVLPSKVKQKIGFYGTDGWKQDLLEMVDADHLPAFLGGTKTDPDGNPLCKTFVMRGQPIPERYFRCQERGQLAAAADSTKLTVLPFSREEVRLEVNEPNSHIEWEFEVKAGDIDYSVYFKDQTLEEPAQIELVPKQRTDTYNEPEKGKFKCEKVGTYTIMFDNTYSWIHSKQVHYSARIKPPAEIERCDPSEIDVIISSSPNNC